MADYRYNLLGSSRARGRVTRLDHDDLSKEAGL